MDQQGREDKKKRRQKRRSRFARGNATNLKLTKRDQGILLALYRYRFLTSEHLAQLFEVIDGQGKISTAFTRRLRLLYDAKYIDRPKAQLHSLAYADKRPMVYALGNKGAEIMANRFQLRLPDIEMPNIYWTEKNRRVKEIFIEHKLGIADFMVKLELACRGTQQEGETATRNPENHKPKHENLKQTNWEVRLISADEILSFAPPKTRRAKNAFAWQTQIEWNGKQEVMAVVPDAVFGLEIRTRPDGLAKETNSFRPQRKFFFLEIDRGTMPIIRSRDLRQSSFVRKLLSYNDTHRRGLHKDRFGFSNFRVLTVTTSKARIESMQAAWRNMDNPAPANLFLFQTKEALEKSDPLSLVWWNANNEECRLF